MAMAMARFTATVQDAEGNAVPGCEIEVRTEDAGQLVQLYADRNGEQALGNPFVASEETFGFHVVGGSYRVTARKGALERVWRYVAVGTLQEMDFEQFLISSQAGLAFFATYAELQAYVPDSEDENSRFAAAVLGDENRELNGYYIWDDASGEWVFASPLSSGLALLVDWGGSANAQTAEVRGRSLVENATLFFGVPEQTNTGAMTLDIGFGPVPVVGAAGGPVIPGQWTEGVGVIFYLTPDNEFMLLTDATLASAVALAASDAAASAADAKAWAEAAGEVALPENVVTEPKLGRALSARVGSMFDTVADLIADATLTYSIVSSGDSITAQGFRYEVAASGATDAQIETAGGVKLYVLRQPGNILQPEQWNAVGDGVADDAAIVQACVDYAESLPNSVVHLRPRGLGYGVSETIDFGAGEYETVYLGSGLSTGGQDAVTFVKLANVVAWRVVNQASQPVLTDISVMGRGNDDPALTDALIESTPGALLHARCWVIRPMFIRCGGLAGLSNEINTTGYAFGIYQFEGGNCNYVNVEGAVMMSAPGDGIYVGKDAAAILNVNAMKIGIRNCYRCAGYAVNADHGFRNDYFLQHFNRAGATVPGVFRLNYVDNVAYCQYVEGGPQTGVVFGGGAGRCVVTFQYGSVLALLYENLGNNRVIDLCRGREYVGAASGNMKRGIIGPSGFAVATSQADYDALNQGAILGLSGVTPSSPAIESRTAVTTSRNHLVLANPNGVVGSVSTGGTTTTYNTTSDATRKEDQGLINLEQARAVLDLIQFHQFRWKVDGKEDWGVFAQELFEVYPAAVTRGGWRDPDTEEWLDEDNGSEYQPWGVDYSKLVTILGACLQGVLARQDDFDERLAALES